MLRAHAARPAGEAVARPDGVHGHAAAPHHVGARRARDDGVDERAPRRAGSRSRTSRTAQIPGPARRHAGARSIARTGRRRCRSSSTSTAAAGCSAASTSHDVRLPRARQRLGLRAARDRLPARARAYASPPRSTTATRRPSGRPRTRPRSASIRRASPIGGDSAGGNLTAVVAQLARDRGGPPLRFQLLVYPATDANTDTPSYRENANGYFLELDGMRWFYDHYLPRDADRSDPRASPLRTADLRGLPPALGRSRPSSIRCATRARRMPRGCATPACRSRSPATTA